MRFYSSSDNNNVLERIKNFTIRFILISLIATTLITIVNCSEQTNNPDDLKNLKKLSFCKDDDKRTISRRLLYVTTLDGKLTALDLTNDGSRLWSINTEPGSLISSSIHRLELTNNGQWIRMIPSLNGGLYKFDGENIDPIPITVDNLLSSSFKFSDDLVISGGKETRSYGISARTGQILYECSMQGCINSTDSLQTNTNEGIIKNNNKDNHDPLIDDLMVVRRQTQTVRAIEPRTGTERWNFSVGHHELEFVQSNECHDRTRTQNELDVLNIDIKIIVPEGIILAFNKYNTKDILWQFKFDHPIVSVWRVDGNDRIQNIDLFNSVQWLWNYGKDFINSEGWMSPSIYVGMFRKQLYIQESKDLMNSLMKTTRNLDLNFLNDEINLPRIPWKPISATFKNHLLITDDNTKIGPENNQALDNKETNKEHFIEKNENNYDITAISVLYASEYVNGNGFFLYTSSDINETNNALCNSKNSTETLENYEEQDEFNFEFTDETPVKIIIVSLWFWWKEIVVISLTSALVLNLFISPRIRGERQVVVIERHIPVPTAIEATEDSMMFRSRSSNRSLSESNSNESNGEFRSRFQSDFDLLQCLGKGGFGVVFEAKNKIDDCNYAIKRISLPNKKESRDRVMREVKTLANCEHQNIVRYFQAWVENPPPGWQEEEDAKWMQTNMLSTSIDIETPDGTTLPPFPSKTWDSIKRVAIAGNSNEFNKNKTINSWISNINSKNSINKGCEDSLHYFNHKNTNNDSSSFIQFKSDSNDIDECDINGNNENSRNAKISFGPPHCELDSSDASDSFEIEFKSPSNEENFTFNKSKLSIIDDNQSLITNNKQNTSISSELSKSYSDCHKKNRHKRPLSLDLSSKGNVIVPISSLQNKRFQQQQQQNKVYLYIQMQLCRKQSLKDWLREHQTDMRRPHIRNIFEQIIDAVGYVHSKGLIHRDLKPSNIFFSLDGQIKIGDFGLVTDMPPTTSSINSNTMTSTSNENQLHFFRHTQKVGTHLYMSPEQLKGLPYDYKVDIFSLGLIFFELLTYFSTESERIKTFLDLRDGKFPNDFPNNHPNEYDLLNLMLSKTPNNRPTTFQIREKVNSMDSWLFQSGNQNDDNNKNSFHLEYKTTTKCVSEISSSS